jgi:C-terminal processing protease CtpA/Prc
MSQLQALAVPMDHFTREDERRDISFALDNDEKGIGLVVEDAVHAHAFPRIVKINPASSAWREAKIKVGLRVRSINGVRAVGMTAREVTKRCSIKAGKHIRVNLAPPEM